ncbi:hypothetical protein ACMFMF_001071 [Clarireedia jacksonii]
MSNTASTPNAPDPANIPGDSGSSSSSSAISPTGTSSSPSKDSSATPQTPPQKTPLWSYSNGKPAPWRVDDSMNVKGLNRGGKNTDRSEQ